MLRATRCAGADVDVDASVAKAGEILQNHLT